VRSQRRRIAEGLSQVHAALGSPLTGQGLADRLSVSKQKLERAFEAELGRTPAGFWRSLRLDHAAALLGDTELPLQEVAEASGFQSFQHFCKLFKRKHGLTPGGFRRERRRG